MPQEYLDHFSIGVYTDRCNKALTVLHEIVEQFTTWANTYSEKFFSVPLAVAIDLHQRVLEIKRALLAPDADYHELRDKQNALMKVQTKSFNVLGNIAKEQLFREGFTADNLLTTYLFWANIDLTCHNGRVSDVQPIAYDFLRDAPFVRVFSLNDLYLIGEPDEIYFDNYWNHIQFPARYPYDIVLECDKNDHRRTNHSVSNSITDDNDDIEYVKLEDGEYSVFEEREKKLIVMPELRRLPNPFDL